VEAGANQVSGPAMTVDDQDELYREALKEAVEQARGHARTLADATGVDLGRVTAVVESGTAVQPPVMMREGLAAADSSTPIEPGKQEVSATVSVTFAIS
jgi:uncharacterized protein